MNNAPQSCQDESGLLKVLNTEDKKNEKLNSTEDLYICEKEGNVFKGNKISLKFVPTTNKIDRAKLKTELEEYGRKLRLMWHFRNDERSFVADRFRPKSSFNPRNKDVIIETYLSCLEERLLDIEIPSKRFNNLTREEREALYSLKDDPSIIIKGAENCLKEAYR